MEKRFRISVMHMQHCRDHKCPAFGIREPSNHHWFHRVLYLVSMVHLRLYLREIKRATTSSNDFGEIFPSSVLTQNFCECIQCWQFSLQIHLDWNPQQFFKKNNDILGNSNNTNFDNNVERVWKNKSIYFYYYFKIVKRAEQNKWRSAITSNNNDCELFAFNANNGMIQKHKLFCSRQQSIFFIICEPMCKHCVITHIHIKVRSHKIMSTQSLLRSLHRWTFVHRHSTIESSYVDCCWTNSVGSFLSFRTISAKSTKANTIASIRSNKI